MSPGIAVGDLLENVGFLVEGLAADLDVHAEVGTDIKRRVNVDELEAAGFFDLGAEGTGFEGGEDEFVIAPDEFVGPALDLAAAGVEAKLVISASFLPGFVNVFQRLEWQNGRTDFASLAVPDEFNLAFVIEEEEAVFLRQRLPLINELDEVTLLGIRQFVTFSRATNRRKPAWMLQFRQIR